MKRYLLFGGYDYMAGGGWDYLVDSFDTIKEAKKVIYNQRRNFDWHHIVDCQIGKKIIEFEHCFDDIKEIKNR